MSEFSHEPPTQEVRQCKHHVGEFPDKWLSQGGAVEYPPEYKDQEEELNS